MTWMLSLSLVVTLLLVIVFPAGIAEIVSNASNTEKSTVSRLLTSKLLRTRQQSQQNSRESLPRIAILLTYAGSSSSSIIPYFNVFCTGAGAAADIADFLVFHTGILDSCPILVDCPSNVQFISLRSNEEFAQRLLRVIDEKIDYMNSTEVKHLHALLAGFIKVNPYGLVEFKPALGHIFSDYIKNYSHWGYSDFDILFADLGRWITDDELDDFDIVTYSYGDQTRLYARGQFTFHKNNAKINQIWRACDYLTQMDERFANILEKKAHYSTESAEGCYSAAILNRTDIKVKYATKAWTDTKDDGGRQLFDQQQEEDTALSNGIYLSMREKSRRLVIYKARDRSGGMGVLQLPANWFEIDKVYNNKHLPLQRPDEDMQPIDLSNRTVHKCMYWVQPRYQDQICLSVDVAPNESVFWINGKLFRQRFTIVPLEANVLTAPFFHFQEWKRSMRFAQVASLHSSLSYATFAFTALGIIPLGPLGFTGPSAREPPQQPPKQSYCLFFQLDENNKSIKCKGQATWRDATIISHAPGWTNLERETDVTLVLTMQVPSMHQEDPEILRAAVIHLVDNIARWSDQPCVCIIFVAGASDENVELLNQLLKRQEPSRFQNALIAVLFEETDLTVSRKALINMAIDAVPTRWYISGLELERGVTISRDAVFFAHRNAVSHRAYRGGVFVIPQFALANGIANDIGLNEMMILRNQSKALPLSELEDDCDSFPKKPILEALTNLWWDDTAMLLRFRDATDERLASLSIMRQAETLEAFQRHALTLLADGSNEALDAVNESPILMIDNAGPRTGIVTNRIDREIEEFSGLGCYNLLRIAHLAGLGYRFGVLSGAFAVSSEVTRRMFSYNYVTRCQGCSPIEGGNRVLAKILSQEAQRVARASILWNDAA